MSRKKSTAGKKKGATPKRGAARADNPPAVTSSLFQELQRLAQGCGFGKPKERAGLKRGRPIDVERQQITERALAYRGKHPSVSFGKLAQMFDPQYKSNKKNAADRMRLNMEYHLEREIARLNEEAAYWQQKLASIREKSL